MQSTFLVLLLQLQIDSVQLVLGIPQLAFQLSYLPSPLLLLKFLLLLQLIQLLLHLFNVGNVRSRARVLLAFLLLLRFQSIQLLALLF